MNHDNEIPVFTYGTPVAIGAVLSHRGPACADYRRMHTPKDASGSAIGCALASMAEAVAVVIAKALENENH